MSKKSNKIKKTAKSKPKEIKKELDVNTEEQIQKEKDKVVHDWSDAGVRVEKARWGRHHIIRGKQKVEIGKEIDATKLSLDAAEKYLGKPKTKSKAKPKKKAAKKR